MIPHWKIDKGVAELASYMSYDDLCKTMVSFLMMRIMVMVNSNDLVDKTIVPEPVKLNKKRVRKGLSPIQEYTTLSLSRRMVEATGIGKSGTSKCRHSVRSHPRKLASGEVIQVKAHTRGSGPTKGPKYKVTR